MWILINGLHPTTFIQKCRALGGTSSVLPHYYYYLLDQLLLWFSLTGQNPKLNCHCDVTTNTSHQVSIRPTIFYMELLGPEFPTPEAFLKTTLLIWIRSITPDDKSIWFSFKSMVKVLPKLGTSRSSATYPSCGQESHQNSFRLTVACQHNCRRQYQQ